MKTPEEALRLTRRLLNSVDALATQAEYGKGIWILEDDKKASYVTELTTIFGWQSPKATMQVLGQCALCDYRKQAVVIRSTDDGQKFMYRVDLI